MQVRIPSLIPPRMTKPIDPLPVIGRTGSQVVTRCSWCKEWGKPSPKGQCRWCGELFVPVELTGRPKPGGSA